MSNSRHPREQKRLVLFRCMSDHTDQKKQPYGWHATMNKSASYVNSFQLLLPANTDRHCCACTRASLRMATNSYCWLFLRSTLCGTETRRLRHFPEHAELIKHSMDSWALPLCGRSRNSFATRGSHYIDPIWLLDKILLHALMPKK